VALKDHGVREIFGIPGDFVLPLFKRPRPRGSTGSSRSAPLR
jgi:thiamine pyrophosphate-dependent acetolactate synthase large subunit-like protein